MTEEKMKERSRDIIKEHEDAVVRPAQGKRRHDQGQSKVFHHFAKDDSCITTAVTISCTLPQSCTNSPNAGCQDQQSGCPERYLSCYDSNFFMRRRDSQERGTYQFAMELVDERRDESACQKQPRQRATSAPHEFKDEKRCRGNHDEQDKVTTVLLPVNANKHNNSKPKSLKTANSET